MPESEPPVWKARARALVLGNPDAKWRYAIYNDAGIIDGALRDVGEQTRPDDAQAQLLLQVETDTGQKYVATWTQDNPLWWSAELAITN